ncbi:MAG: single-stranded DNA-binding protein [Protaetiibacter sp.]
MVDIITVAGLMATPVKHTVTGEGLEVSQFRLASSSRRFDPATRSWVDGETNWFTVVAFRQLAANVAASLEKGHRVLVSGRLKVRDWQDGEKKGRNVEIVADAIGPDLAWGRAQYARTPRAASADAGPIVAAGAEGVPEEAGFPVDAQEPVTVPF